MPVPGQILVVCTGNVCRSPAAQVLLSHALDASVTVRSAGTHALIGHPIDPPMARYLSPGHASDGFRSRQLDDSMVQEAQLVLTMTREHRALVLAMAPLALRRTFTLLEFVHLSEELSHATGSARTDAERLALLLPMAYHQRGTSHPTNDAYDVVDPYRQPETVYEKSFRAVESAVNRLVLSLRKQGC